MRIVHLIDYFQPKLGYQEFYLAREQQKMGHEVHVVTSDRYFPFPNYEKNFKKVLGNRIVGTGDFIERGVKVRRLPILFEYKKSAVVILRSLRKTLLELKPDVVHAHGCFSPAAFLAAFYKPFIGYALVYDNHAADFNTNFKDTLLKRIYYLIFFNFAAPIIKKNADIFLPIGEPEQRFLCREFKLPKKRAPVVKMGVDTILFKSSQKKRREIRKRLGVNPLDVLLIYTGKVSSNKDLHILLKALKPIFQKRKEVKLLIVGSGDSEYVRSLKEIIANFRTRVIWHDFVETSRLPEFYSASDIGVWPGDASISRMEGMACALPIVLPFWFGTMDLTQSGGVVNSRRGRVKELTKILDSLIKNPEKREKMGEKSRIFAKNVLDWQAVTRETLQFYQKFLKKIKKT